MIEARKQQDVGGGAMIVVATALLAIGVVMVTSTTAPLDRPLLGPGWWKTTYSRQALFAIVGFVAMLLTSRVASRILASPAARRNVSWAVFVVATACLVAALIPGLADAHRGSQRWIRLPVSGFPIGFQPSELAKLAMVVVLASILSRRGADPRDWRRCFLPAAGVVAVCTALVGKADFGTAVLLSGVGIAMLLVAGCRLSHLAGLAAVGACGMAGLLFAVPYRLARITAFLSFGSDPRGHGYQPLQSLTAIASGGWTGTGLGSGLQKHGYLPECHSDFIFAIICEEMGLLGGGLVILLFFTLVVLGLRAMLSAATRFERLCALGLTVMFGLQATMNIAVVTVVTPTTGIPLPLVSSGGSGLMVFCLAAGILSAIAARGGTGAFVTAADPADGTFDGTEEIENATSRLQGTVTW